MNCGKPSNPMVRDDPHHPMIEMVERLADLVADVLSPPPSDTVDTFYVASRLGCTTTWIADIFRRGEIPPDCIVPGTGHGKPWKFRRARIDAWTESR